MDEKIILKNHIQQKQVNIFHQVFSMSKISLFKDTKNKYNVYRGKDCMKKFCECLKKHARRIINFEKQKMKLLTNEQQELYEKRKSAIFVEKNMKINMLMVKRFVKLEIIVVMQVNIEVLRICNLKCSTPK